ncbi:MAG: ribosome maturation factor RimM [Thermodesulfobacteriota bacterium]
MATDRYLSIGKISGVHGLCGNLKIHPYADDLSDISIGSCLIIRRQTDTKNERAVTVTGWRPHGRGFLLSCEEITSRSQAEEEIGGELVILRSGLPDPGEGTYYWVDIIGLSVFTLENVFVGRVREIMPTGSNDVYVIYNPETAEEILLPAIRSVVREIDLSAGIMRVTLPEMTG